jgi:hypothetical protein
MLFLKVLRQQPKNLYKFGAVYFDDLFRAQTEGPFSLAFHQIGFGLFLFIYTFFF